MFVTSYFCYSSLIRIPENIVCCTGNLALIVNNYQAVSLDSQNKTNNILKTRNCMFLCKTLYNIYELILIILVSFSSRIIWIRHSHAIIEQGIRVTCLYYFRLQVVESWLDFNWISLYASKAAWIILQWSRVKMFLHKHTHMRGQETPTYRSRISSQKYAFNRQAFT